MYDATHLHGEARTILQLKQRIKELEEENKKLKEASKTVK